MFEAFVIFCALQGGEPILERCVYFSDDWGPYESQEDCQERASEMETGILESEVIMMAILRNLMTSNIGSRSICVEQEPEGELL